MNIYVGNLSRFATEEALRNLFAPFGDVANVRVMKDKFSGEPRGFAFVDMPNDDEAQKAIAELNGSEFEGQNIRVNEARPPEQRNGGGRGGFGGSRGGRDRGGYNRGGDRGGYNRGGGGGFGGY